MTEKQELFVREYLKDFNGTRSYKEAYDIKDDNAAAASAWRLLRNVKIQEAIQKQANKRMEKVEIDVDYILNNIKEVTERCMQKESVMFFDRANKEYKQDTEYVEDEEGNEVRANVWKFDATNALKGLELLGKYKNMFNDNKNVINNIINPYENLSEEELRKLADDS